LIGTGKIKTFVQAILEHDGPITFDVDMYTTEASIYMLYNDHGFTGIPPGKDETWSKKALCDTLQKIE
jgi:hypothetical protein